MQGYVLVFRPGTGHGTIVTEEGAEVRFSAAGGAPEFQGGDIVSFQLERSRADAQPTKANDIRLVQKWSDRLAASCQPLLRQLHSLVEIDASCR
jgi:cold shock CspA family protein